MTTHNNNLVRTWVSWTPYLLSILRIVTAAMFILSGTMKLFAYPNGMPPDNSTAVMWTQPWVGGVLEFVGGLLMLVGLWTRPVAFILAGEMAVAYWQFHAPGSPFPTVNMGVSAVLYCFVFLYFSSAGPGPWSIDAMRKRD